MQHLTEEQLVAHYYRDEDFTHHVGECVECRAQFEAICGVLAIVKTASVPDRGETYGQDVWNALRWKLGSEKRRTRAWQSLIALAAMLAVGFFAGHLWRARHDVAPLQIAAVSKQPSTVSTTAPGRDRILFVVLGDHLDVSERVLMEVANADRGKPLNIVNEQRRAEDLVAANRIYRQTATSRGDERIAALLADIEPVLVELSHARGSMSAEDVAKLQKRIESKGLLFKVRVISAQVGGNGQSPPTPPANVSL